MGVATLDALTAHFPLTLPIPTPTTVPGLVTTKDLHREEDLIRNPTSFRAWWTAIGTARDAFATFQRTEQPPDLSAEDIALLGPLASPHARLSLQRLTYLYEAALSQFPASFKLWKSYLHMRMSFVLGKQEHKKKAGGRKKFPDMKDALDEEKGEIERWEAGLDSVVGWNEWRSLVSVFERALMWLPKVSLWSGLCP
jgi:pre-mRNA-splicing factor SYF1